VLVAAGAAEIAGDAAKLRRGGGLALASPLLKGHRRTPLRETQLEYAAPQVLVLPSSALVVVVVGFGHGAQGHNDRDRLRGSGGESAVPREDGAESGRPRGAACGSEQRRRHLVSWEHRRVLLDSTGENDDLLSERWFAGQQAQT
jgi:hypothetical protein